ncbi:MAG: hypothetical protein FJ316_09260 [SAR202 cluster bacterium]|nr:hypothetical protein [SAR202 cluster bacterium]
MGLDVGVVNITYLEYPNEPVYDFLCALAGGELGEDWGGGWGGNALVEFRKYSLLQKAGNWAEDKGLATQERELLRQWIEDLPWRNDDIMLFLSR